MKVDHLLSQNQSPKESQNKSKQRVTVIRSQDHNVTGLYNNGIKIDSLNSLSKYTTEELVVAVDQHCYDDVFFKSETDMSYALEQAKFVHEIDSFIEEILR